MSTDSSPAYSHWDSLTVVELAVLFPQSSPCRRVYHFNIPPWSSSFIVKWAVIVHSHTHRPIEITGQTGAGKSWGSTQAADSVRRALTFYNLRHQTRKTKRVAGFHVNRADWSEVNVQRLFATPCLHTSLFLIWLRLLREIKWQTSPPAGHKVSPTAWPEKKQRVTRLTSVSNGIHYKPGLSHII